ncbi:MAG: B12-binding domain-containing radical SAM protein, partial [Candidatus Margulisiibacteriota bacterium]
PPLDLLNCAALLDLNGFTTEVLDARAMKLTLAEIKNKVLESDLTFITSSPLDRWQCPNLEVEDFISFVNLLGNQEKIYLMGALATIYPQELLSRTKVRGVIKAEPENAVLAVCRGETKTKIIEPIEVDLGNLPIPAYSKINLDYYYYELMGKRFALLETARGCPFQCSYCFKVMYGDRVRKKPIEKVKEEIDYLVKEIKAENIYFIDLEFTLERSRVNEICEYIVTKGYRFHWCCQTRADAVDYEMLKLMRKSGCTLIHYGVESGSQRVLDFIKKGITLEKITEAFAWTKRAGIAVAGFFMLGFPEETEEEMNETISFAQKLNPDYASFHVVIPYPGTKQEK